ncbi:MAG: Mur ligase family protein [Candidatus Omnitrophota bacterium]
MVNTDYYKGKNITVAGLARSGLACSNLLYALGADVSVTDNNDTHITRTNANLLVSKKIKVELGKHTREFISGRDFLVISPGVANNALPVIWAQDQGIPVISEIEVAASLCPATIIAVTGSNGKTTVTTLIGRTLEEAGRKVFVCGNIGKPFSQEVEKMKSEDFVSLEISSFQLERIIGFKPKISVMLNFSANHLDRYDNIREYLAAKKRIFINQDNNDYLVVGRDDPVLRESSKEANAKVVYFSSTAELNPNQAAVLAVASLIGVDMQTVLRVFDGFQGIEHRMEQVSRINGITFINDSKSTTVESAIWAMKNINVPIIWIAGGKHKGVDYNNVLDSAKDKVKEVVLIGEAAGILEEVFRGNFSVERANTLEEAVSKAYHKASAGDCVLLSPMCSSFDMFLNYEERGKQFKQAVSCLAQAKAGDNAKNKA